MGSALVIVRGRLPVLSSTRRRRPLRVLASRLHAPWPPDADRRRAARQVLPAREVAHGAPRPAPRRARRGDDGRRPATCSPRCRSCTRSSSSRSEPRALEAAARVGATVVHDPQEAGHNPAAARGARAAAERGAERVLLVPGDCPGLDAGEVTTLLEEDQPGVTDRPGPARRPAPTRSCWRRRT